VICPERLRLAISHRETTRAYSEAVRKMTEMMGMGLESEVAVLRNTCRVMSEASDKGRLALARHEADHFCDRTDFATPTPASGSRTG